MQEHPTAADIMEEVRQGLNGISLSDASRAHLEQHAGVQNHLRQTHEYSAVLGRCGGSLRGKGCKLLAPIIKPVIEQLDLFHHAVIRTLEQVAGIQSDTRAKMENIEARLQALESKEPPKRET